MSELIQAIYKNGVLHPLKPLDLPEDKVIELEVRDVSEKSEEISINAEKLKIFEEWMNSLDPNIPNLTDEQISRESIYEDRLNRQRWQ